ncbi:COG1361 S-layer family protein [Candidatus Mancarchaeum acidiphilum]|nr:COG1361 S-layer family protein [Candidatus Mancarchaeum acidiphilum]
MYKISLISLCIIVLGLAGISSAQGLSQVSGALSITNLQISPSPLVAGENATISFNLYNSYSHSLYDINLQLLSQNPMLNFSPVYSNIIYNIGEGTDNDGVFYFTFRVPKNIPAGEYEIDAVATYRSKFAETPTFTTSEPGESEMPIYIYIYGKPVLSASIQQANPIVPESDANLEIDLTNLGNGVADNVTVILHNSTYLKFIGQSKFSISDLPNSQSTDLSAQAYVSRGITSGVQDINATLVYENMFGNKTVENETLPINVLINSPEISVSTSSSVPETLYSGGNQTITLLISNSGLGTAKNLTLSLLPNQNITYGSMDKFFIPTLEPGSSNTEPIYIKLGREFEGNSTKLPIELTYSNANLKNSTSRNFSINISVQKSAIINIENLSDTLLPGATDVPVTLQIKNTGNEEAQEMTLSFESVYPITPVDSNSYVNALQPGQSVNVTFYVNVDSKATAGSYPITIYEEWLQPNGGPTQEFSGTNNYYVEVYSSSKKSSADSFINYIYALIIIIVVIYIIFRILKRSSSKGKK